MEFLLRLSGLFYICNERCREKNDGEAVDRENNIA